MDDYGCYLTVHVGEQLVCSTHITKAFIIPGAWIETVLARYPEAEGLHRSRALEAETARRRQLVRQLGAEGN